MALCGRFIQPPCRSLGFVLIIYFSCWATNHSYGKALAIPDDNAEKIITSKGLLPEEESVFNGIVEEISANTEKSWYSDFGPGTHSSIKEAADLKEVLKILNLADSGMGVVKMVEKRLEEIEKKKRDAMGIWASTEPKRIVPYRISTNSRDLILEIANHDCMENKAARLPGNDTIDVDGSTWLGRTDRVYVPFKCPMVYDFNLAEELQNLQKLRARTRTKREIKSKNPQVNIIQVNMTITSEQFEKSLLNIKSNPYIWLMRNLTEEINEVFNNVDGYKGVNDFSFRNGSVIVTFHIEINGANSSSTVKTRLENVTVGGSFGTFTIDKNRTQVEQRSDDNAVYSPWTSWSDCSKSCGKGVQERTRTCNSTAPLACAHLGSSKETQDCYLQFCSQGCRKIFSGDSGNFSSPTESNGKYPKLAECVWQIQVDENHTIVAYFQDFELERDKKCKYDYVAFYDKAIADPSLDTKSQLMRFCGNSTPPRGIPDYGYPINSSDSALTIYFKTDSTKEYKGFNIFWRKVLKLELRVSSLIPQSVATLSMMYNPWSKEKDAIIPIGKATTCPESLDNKDCYFMGKQLVISRIISVFLNRQLSLKLDPIEINFEHILVDNLFPSAYIGRKTCVTWDHTISSPHYGAWTKRGCYSITTNLTHTYCKCHHTGIFAVLGETELPPKDLDLKANSYFAVAVSLLFVILTINALSSKESMTTGELFHLFETLVLGLLLVTFLIGAHVPAQKELCGFLAFFLYYLVLSQFTWMLLTVFWIQNLMQRFLSDKVKIKMVYFVLGWFIPFILAGVAGKVDIDQRGNEDNVCWVSIAGAGTVWGYGAPIFVMLMINVAIFVFLIMPSSKENYDQKNMRPRILKEILTMFWFLMVWVMGVRVILDDNFSNQFFFCVFVIIQGVMNFNICFEKTELFWIGKEENVEKEPEEIEKDEISSQDDCNEKQEDAEKVDEQPRMTVKTLKNLNIYKENGVFVIEA